MSKVNRKTKSCFHFYQTCPLLHTCEKSQRKPTEQKAKTPLFPNQSIMPFIAVDVTALATAENQTVDQAGQEKNQYLAVARQTTPS